MASLSTCHLGLWLGWQILLNLVKSSRKIQRDSEEDADVDVCGAIPRLGSVFRTSSFCRETPQDSTKFSPFELLYGSYDSFGTYGHSERVVV